jgi:hypothetical protein
VDANDLQPSLNATEIAETRVRICAHPVFIVGSPRSGTTILAWSLAKHSQLWTSDESQILWDLFEGGRLGKNYRRRDHYDGSWLCKQRVRREEFLGYVGVGLNGLFTSRSNGKRWIDQTPLYVMLAHNLVDMFPGSFFIHILRDGRNVVHSMINVLTARFVGHELPDVVKNSPKPAWMTDFRDACRTWRRFVTVAMELQAAFPRRCLTVRNEQLLADPVQGFREILQFIQAPYEEGPANYFRSTRLNSSFPNVPGKPTELRRSERPWDEWTQEQKTIFVEESGAAMVKYGLANYQELSIPVEGPVDGQAKSSQRSDHLTNR